jgi:hypothetical protein
MYLVTVHILRMNLQGFISAWDKFTRDWSAGMICMILVMNDLQGLTCHSGESDRIYAQT